MGIEKQRGFPTLKKLRLVHVLLIAWGLILFCLLLIAYIGFGIWDKNYQYRYSLERSWALALSILWFIPLSFYILRDVKFAYRIGTIFIVIIISFLCWLTLNPEFRIKRGLSKAHSIRVTSRLIIENADGSRELKEFDLTTIRDPGTVSRLYERLEFTDPTWRILHYFRRYGEFDLILLDQEGLEIMEFGIVNQGSGVLTRTFSNTDRHTTEEFQRDLMVAFFESLPDDGGASLPESNNRALTVCMGLWYSEQAVASLSKKSNSVDDDHKALIASILGKPRMHESAVLTLIDLAKSSHNETRLNALHGLEGFRQVPAAQDYLQTLNLQSVSDE